MDLKPQILIIDLRSQYTLLIARTLRELGFRSAVLDPKKAGTWLRTAKNVRAIILSGGDGSVYEKNAPEPPKEIFTARVPILAICYGHQWLAQHFGGRVKRISGEEEYGSTKIRTVGNAVLFRGVPKAEKVWASHGDSVSRIPKGFSVTARSIKTGGIEAMESADRSIYTLQFHPEVPHTPYGKKMLHNFAERIAHCTKDWEPSAIVSSVQSGVESVLGKSGTAVMGFSGGVDSTTLAAMLAPVLKSRLLGIVIDGGQLREHELTEIRLHAKAAGIRIRIVSAEHRFVRELSTTVDAEEKRKRFKKIYTAILNEEAHRFGGKPALLQGTLATDLIESGATGGATIKSHHNVGIAYSGIQLNPLGELFKYEVRALAESLRLPKSVFARQPFPGPGNFVRIVGAPVTKERLALVSWAYARVEEILQKHGLYDTYSQTVVALLGVNIVGVKGDGRVYGPIILVRAVKTIDFMTAEGVWFPEETAKEICATLTKHKEIVGVVFDPVDKPPRTTEAE